jgi:aminoglycoside phosphotransferase (APT) family kinase protein
MQNRLYPGRRVGTHLRAAGLWLARFHQATRHPARRFRFGPEDRSRVRRMAETTGQGVPAWHRELSELLDHDPLPLAAGHGDFWARNLLLAGRRGGTAPELPAGVVDWEHFRSAAPPFEDLFHFAVTYGANYPWRRYRRLPFREAFRHTFFRENRLALAVRRYVRGYGRRTGSSPRLLDRLFRLYVARRAAGAEYGPARRRWQACWRSLPDPDRLLFGR